MSRTLLSLVLAATLGGCSLVPSYERPDAPVPADWQRTGTQAADTVQTPVQPLDWQAFFQDPQLRELIEVALTNNRDLRVAVLNVEATRALYRIQRAAPLPEVSAEAGGSRARTPASQSATGAAATSNQFSAGLGVSWELDLFGRLSSLSEQALQEYLATDAARRSVQISLIASVANTYLTWQTDQALLQVTRDTLATYDESLAITQRSFDVGVASTLELTQARIAVDTARGSLAQYTRLVEQDRNALSRLLGQPLSVDGISPFVMQDRVLADFPVGLPSELLRNRPDVLQAEHQLLAANANIGAARAAFFPSIGLTAAAGSASSELSGLFEGGSGYWSFAPSVRLPIFNAGRLQASLDSAEIRKDVRVAEYEGAIQTAFREVADGLAARETYAQQVNARADLLATSENYYRIADRRYRTGVDSYLVLLDAQRQLFSAQQQLVGDKLNQLISEVDLFVALGGGWQEAEKLERVKGIEPSS